MVMVRIMILTDVSPRDSLFDLATGVTYTFHLFFT